MYKIHPNVRRILESQMNMWKTTISLNHSDGEIVIPDVKINKGIFQGDSLSPLLFIMALDPLSKELNEEFNKKKGYSLSLERTKEPEKCINHLLFMDDLKLYAGNDKDLEFLLNIVDSFTKDIKMKFGLDKCAKCTVKKGRRVHTQNIVLGEQEIQDLEGDSAYKYLGVEEKENLEHKKMREKIGAEYLKRVRKILKTQLTSKNKITAINQLAIPVISYSIGIINWNQSDINRLDVKTRKMLIGAKVMYRNQCHPRIYLPRSQGGLGLTEIDNLHKSLTVSLGQYIQSAQSPLIKMVRTHQEECESEETSVVKLARNFAGDIMTEDKEEGIKSANIIAKASRKKYSEEYQRRNKDEWKNNKKAERFYEELNKEYIDKEGSVEWLKRGRLTFDGERLIVGAQDQALMTNVFKHMAGLSQTDRCRFCHKEAETTSHLLSGCEILLADGMYTARHNKICAYIHHTICKSLEIPCNEHVWDHEPEPVTGSEQYTLYYDKIIPTARYIENSAIKPDIVIRDKKNKTAVIIDVSVPNDYGINRAEREKINKYQQLKWDMKRNWKLTEVDIIPIIIGATGLYKTNLKTYSESIPGIPALQEMQLCAIKGTIKILKRALGS